jgi:hypothetical protein
MVIAISAPNRHTLRRTFLRRGIAMNVPPKTPVAYARAGRKLADPLTSNPQSRDGTMENCGLKAEILYVFKLVCAKIIPIVGAKNG